MESPDIPGTTTSSRAKDIRRRSSIILEVLSTTPQAENPVPSRSQRSSMDRRCTSKRHHRPHIQRKSTLHSPNLRHTQTQREDKTDLRPKADQRLHETSKVQTGGSQTGRESDPTIRPPSQGRPQRRVLSHRPRQSRPTLRLLRIQRANLYPHRHEHGKRKLPVRLRQNDETNAQEMAGTGHQSCHILRRHVADGPRKLDCIPAGDHSGRPPKPRMDPQPRKIKPHPFALQRISRSRNRRRHGTTISEATQEKEECHSSRIRTFLTIQRSDGPVQIRHEDRGTRRLHLSGHARSGGAGETPIQRNRSDFADGLEQEIDASITRNKIGHRPLSPESPHGPKKTPPARSRNRNQVRCLSSRLGSHRYSKRKGTSHYPEKCKRPSTYQPNRTPGSALGTLHLRKTYQRLGPQRGQVEDRQHNLRGIRPEGYRPEPQIGSNGPKNCHARTKLGFNSSSRIYPRERELLSGHPEQIPESQGRRLRRAIPVPNTEANSSVQRD